MGEISTDVGSPLYRSEDMRAIDRAAIDRLGIPAFELMTRAARASFEALRRDWPQARRIVVFCGSGNNGGDGFVLARLAREAGFDVVVHAAAESGTPESRRARSDWRAAGGEVLALDDVASLGHPDVVVDALLGIGLARAPSGAIAHAIEAINRARRPVLALDVPSGLDADAGATPGVAIEASRTLCFIAGKRGLATGRARALCGDVAIDTLGVDDDAFDGIPVAARRLDARDLRYWLRPRLRDAHKGSHGYVLAIGGDEGYGGAIRLCAEAAMRSGAGYVAVATRVAHVAALLAARPEAMVRVADDAAALRPMIERSTVLALGPGLGQGAWGRTLADVAFASDRPKIADADALNLLAAAPCDLGDAILTPHPGEAARLLGTEVASVERDRYAAAQAISERYRACVVLKGAGSIVAEVGRVPCVIGAGNPGMASPGMGDVLTGVIAALRAQGLARFDAACAGALLHAAAGDATAARDGERGLLASDLFPHLRTLANPTCD